MYEVEIQRSNMNIYEYFLTKNKENARKIAMSIRLSGGDIKSYTYGQLFDKVDIFGDLLSCAGIEPGDRVAVAAENCPEWCAAYLAIAKLHATAVLIDTSLEREELCRLLDKSKVRCICTTPKTFERLNSFSGISVINILNNAGFFNEVRCAVQTIGSDENISTIIFSSGTTKAASGIMHSHESMLSTSKMIEKCLGVKHDDRSLAVVPNSHIYGLITQVIIPLYLGASVCYLESINGDMINGALQEFQPTFLPAVPKMYELFKSQIMRKINGSPKTQKAFAALFPKCLALRKKTGINMGKVFFKDIHKAFGSKMRILCSAGAPLNAETAEFSSR